MADDAKNVKANYRYHKNIKRTGASGGMYTLGFIGALVYYFQQANSFWTVVLGFLKACVWPAFLVHDLLKFIHL